MAGGTAVGSAVGGLLVVYVPGGWVELPLGCVLIGRLFACSRLAKRVLVAGCRATRGARPRSACPKDQPPLEELRPFGLVLLRVELGVPPGSSPQA